MSAVFSLNTMRQTYCDSLHDPKFLSLLVTVVQLDSISNMVYSPTVFQHLKRKRTSSGNIASQAGLAIFRYIHYDIVTVIIQSPEGGFSLAPAPAALGRDCGASRLAQTACAGSHTCVQGRKREGTPSLQSPLSFTHQVPPFSLKHCLLNVG